MWGRVGSTVVCDSAGQLGAFSGCVLTSILLFFLAVQAWHLPESGLSNVVMTHGCCRIRLSCAPVVTLVCRSEVLVMGLMCWLEQALRGWLAVRLAVQSQHYIP